MTTVLKAVIVFALFVGILYGLVTLLFNFVLPEWAIAVLYGLALISGAMLLERFRSSRAG